MRPFSEYEKDLDRAFGQGCVIGILITLVLDLIVILIASEFLEGMLKP